MDDSSVSPLLALPSEILQQIFRTCCTTSFLQLYLTSKQLYQEAQNSWTTLLHHLRIVPGIQLGLDEKSAVSPGELFLTLRRRAIFHLYGINPDRISFTLGGDHLDPARCDIGNAPIDQDNVILVPRSRSHVHALRITCGSLANAKVLPVPRINKVPAQVEFVCLAQLGGITVLYSKQGGTICTCPRFEKCSQKSGSFDVSSYIVTYSSAYGTHFSARMIDHPPHTVPISIASYSSLQFAAVWENKDINLSKCVRHVTSYRTRALKG